METLRLNPLFRDTLVSQLEDHLRDLLAERERGIESISTKTYAKFNEDMTRQISSVNASIVILKDMS